MNYVITKDYIDDGLNETEEIPSEFTLKFRLYDDDGELYFEGLMKPTRVESIFTPLDNIGVSYGCTKMRIYKDGGWTDI